jgi:F-type H+-transporting ATPase subunit delta
MRISAKQYTQTLFDLTDGKSKSEAEKATVDFARYIYKERKLKLSEKIIEQFGKIYNQKNSIIEVEVVTREKMNEALEKKVKHFVKEKYNAKKVIVKNIVDDAIKGGMILKIGDEIVDGSVAGRLSELKKVLVK